MGTAVLMFALLYGSGDEGSSKLWIILVLLSLVAIFVGLKNLSKKSNQETAF
jgi:hypothetical protein